MPPATASARETAPARVLDWVIDVDTHITEPPDLWASRLPARMRAEAPRIVTIERPDGRGKMELWSVGDGAAAVPVGHTAVAGWPDPFPAAPSGFAECPPASYDATARLAYMDSIGVWATALYPNVGGFGNQAFLQLRDEELKRECVRAYNDFLFDWVAPDPRRFIPIVSLPFWDVAASVAEIERTAKLGAKGLLFTGEPHTHGMPRLASAHWTPLWEAAVAHDLPVSFHLGNGEFTNGFSPDSLRDYGVGATNARTAVQLFLDNGKQLVDLLLSGVLARHPALRVVSVESGIGFIPFVLESCDYAFEYSRIRQERPEFALKPSEYFARQVYGCYFFEEHAPQQLLDDIGVERVLFETDYPHPICLYGNVREKIDAGLAGKPADVRRKVLFENAAKLYRVEAPDRAPDAHA
ncbi:MAG: amidohydrolase family protein [Myxococcota bacterium]